MRIKKALAITYLLVVVIVVANSGNFLISTENYRSENRDSYGEGKESFLNLKTASNISSPLLWYSQTGYDVQTVAISSDGNYIISGSKNYSNNRIGLYHKNSSLPLWVNTDLKGEVLEVDISSDGSYMVAGTGYAAGQGTIIYLFEKNSNTPLWCHQIDNIVFSVAISSDGNYVAAGSRNDRVYLFHRLSSTPIWSFEAGDHISSVDISSDGNYIVAGSGDHNVYLFHKSSSTPIWNHTVDHIPGYAGDVETVAISSNGSYIVAGTQIYEGTSQVYLFHRSNSSPIWKYASGNYINSVSISANGEYLVAGGDDKKVFLFQRSSSSPLWSFTAFSSISSVSISADGNFIVAGGYLWDHTVYFFSRTNNTPIWRYITNDIVNSVAISSNGDFSVAGSVDENVYLFMLNDTYIDIITPEEKMYFYPMEGYYPATFGFENCENGNLPSNWSFVPHHDYGEAYVVDNIDGHNKVLKIEDTYHLAYPEAFQEFNSQTIGTIELYLRKESGASGFYLNFYDNLGVIAFNIKMDQNNNGKFEIGLVNDFTEFATGKYSDQTWFHFRIDFNTYTDEASIFLDGNRVIDIEFSNNVNYITRIRLGANYANTGVFYADAIGYSWDDNYDVGDNLHEGLLLSYLNRTNLNWIAYSLDGNTYITILGDTVIPLPENGNHNIVISGITTTGTTIRSNSRYFSVFTSEPPIPPFPPVPPDLPVFLPVFLTSILIGLVSLIGIAFIVFRIRKPRQSSPIVTYHEEPQLEQKLYSASVQVKFCPFCGSQIRNTYRFCIKCGASLKNI